MFARIFCTLLVACLLTDIVEANFGAIFEANNEESKNIPGGWYTATGAVAKPRKKDENGDDDEEQTFSSEDDAPEVKLFEGDIVFDKRVENILNGELTFDAAVDMQWTGNKVPYIIANTHAQYIEKFILRGIKMFDRQLNKCIEWVPYKDRSALKEAGIKNYVMFFVGGGCFSNIGMITGEQRISIGRGCTHTGTVMHEMMHALGFWHEQSRLDRDQHIVIYKENIERDMMFNFDQYKKGQATTLDEPYDIKSIMHYPPKAFSRNGRVVIVHKFGEKSFGWQQKLSKIDINQLRKYYKCDAQTATGGGTTNTEPVKKKVNGSWSRWSGWSACTKVCGGGTKLSTRKCNDPAPAHGGKTCRGRSSFTASCNIQSCNCKDRNSKCKTWKKYCTGRYEKYMKKNCKKTCEIKIC